MHLTNASISKENYNNKKIKVEGSYEIQDNMWETHNFAQFLSDQYSESTESKDPLGEKVFP